MLAHRPHWTQFFSKKRSCGRSALSASAASGQAPTQARHRVQAAVSTIRLPNGLAGAGRAIASGTLGADCSRWSIARSSVVRLSAWTLKVAARATPFAAGAARARSTAASAGSVARTPRLATANAGPEARAEAGSIVTPAASTIAKWPVPKPSPARIASATSICAATARR